MAAPGRRPPELQLEVAIELIQERMRQRERETDDRAGRLERQFEEQIHALDVRFTDLARVLLGTNGTQGLVEHTRVQRDEIAQLKLARRQLQARIWQVASALVIGMALAWGGLSVRARPPVTPEVVSKIVEPLYRRVYQLEEKQQQNRPVPPSGDN